MNPATLLIPVILGAALVYAALTGHLTQEQLAAGGLLLLAPGADRFGPLLRQLLRPGQRPEFETVDDDDALEHTYRVFDAERKRSGDERPLWKKYMLAALQGQIGVAPTAPAPAEVHRLAGVAYESYAAATGGKTFDGRPMPTWEQARERIGHAWAAAVTGVLADQAAQPIRLIATPAPAARSTPPSLPPIALLLLLLPLLALAPSCASWPAWRSALAGCGVQMAPAGVEAGVALALRGGDGWAAALAGLASTYGDCLVKAQVLRHAQGEGPEPPRSQAVAAPLEGLIGGELTASSSQVSKAEAERRAAAWLRGHR